MDDDLSMKNLLELAMGLSMASQYRELSSASNSHLSRIMNSGNPVKEPPRYIYAVFGGRQQGPYSLAEVIEYIRSGAITADTYIWKSGMEGWKPAREITDLAPELGAVPPVLPDKL